MKCRSRVLLYDEIVWNKLMIMSGLEQVYKRLQKYSELFKILSIAVLSVSLNRQRQCCHHHKLDCFSFLVQVLQMFVLVKPESEYIMTLDKHLFDSPNLLHTVSIFMLGKYYVKLSLPILLHLLNKCSNLILDFEQFIAMV